MSTLDEQYRFIINLAMNSLKDDMVKHAEEGLNPEEIFKKLAWVTIEDKRDLFFMATWIIDDNLRIQTVIATMYAYYVKNDEEIAEALKAELQVMRLLGAATQNGGMLHVDEMVRISEGHKMLGMSGLWHGVKKKYDWETRRLPIIERGERELEGEA